VRVVLADDSLLLREGVARLLEEAGLEVVAQAGDGEDLLRKVGAHKPDVAIVDVRMPGMDGYEVARHARGNPVTREVPIIFLTAAASNEDSVLRGYGSGAVDFLLKPVTASILRNH
jgi:CheY-like chemotaxis protein